MSQTDIRSYLREKISAAAEQAGYAGALEGNIVLELPREFSHGDIACPAAFTLAKSVRRPPAEVAGKLAAGIKPDELLERVEVAGGGYVNFFLGVRAWRELFDAIRAAGEKYGNSGILSGERFLVEFISANPTGPLLVVNARQAAFGESLCRCLSAAGAKVEREYYVNDAGAQVRNLALSVEARWRQSKGEKAAIPQDGYQGEYVKDLLGIKELAGLIQKADESGSPISEAIREPVINIMVEGQEKDLRDFNVFFDRWFRESSLHKGRKVEEAFEKLKETGEVFEKDGAQWFRATKFGDEKDRVLKKANGDPTYVLPDLAYHRDKYSRDYTRLINVVGADHQTEMKVLRSALKVMDYDLDKLEVITVQFVNLKRGKEKVVMSKRAGAVFTLRELTEEVGLDAARFFFLLRAPSSHLEFDIELAKARSLENPVYYIQYAHARLCSLTEFAQAQGLATGISEDVRVDLLAEPEEKIVMRKLARFPFIVEKAASGRMPHVLTYEMLDCAQAVHQFYTKHRVVGGGSPELTAARLALVCASRRVLANGLDLLGVNAPEKM